MEHHCLGAQARAVVRSERSRDKTAEIEDERQEHRFAAERQGLTKSPKAVQAKDQPTGNDDQTQNKKRKEKTAIHKKRIEYTGHIGRLLVAG